MEYDGEEEEEEYLEVECLPLDEETLLLLERNDTDVAGLSIDANNWIEGAGRGIGNSRYLKEVQISVYGRTESEGNNHWLGELCRGLARNRTIQSLYFWKDDLSTRDREIIDVDIFQILTPFFENNFHIHTVDVHDLDLSQTFNSLVSALSKCSDGQIMEHISINNVNCSDEQAAALFGALGNQDFVHIRFCFSKNKRVGRRGCTALANLIEKSPVHFSALTLIENDLDDECMAIISNSLIYAEVDYLEVIENDTLTSTGWNSISTILSRPMCSINHVCFTGPTISDDVVTCLGDSLAVNETLENLCLYFNESITLAGWRAFSKCLRNINSALTWLSLESCSLDDMGARVIILALAGNSSLKTLNLNSNRAITDMIWKDLVCLICDTTSIGSIYSSNHTFQKLYTNHLARPEVVVSLLTMNRNEDKSEVARQKILKYFFSGGGDKASAFAQMPEKVMPVALEWIGRKVSGFSLMYNVVRGNPTLFDMTHMQQHLRASKRRK
jgi:hypothetical protein